MKKLVENQKIINDDKEIVKILNDFFSSKQKTLNIPQINHSDSNFEIVKDPTLKVTLKYGNHLMYFDNKRKD